MVLIETMACGIPIVTTSSGSIPEVVGDTAVLAAPYAPGALAAALASLLDDPARRAALVEADLQRASERYDADRVAAEIGELNARVIG